MSNVYRENSAFDLVPELKMPFFKYYSDSSINLK